VNAPLGSTEIRLIALGDEPAWIELHESIDPSLKSEALATIFDQLKASGAKATLLEERYLDRDYSAEFSSFYSRLFEQYGRFCRRYHFFSCDLTEIAGDLVGALGSANTNGEYLGFVVIRPVPDAPIGRAVIVGPKAPAGCVTRSLVSATYQAHLLGVTLEVCGVPFTQQDTRISACAQASIWMAGRHFCAKHGGPWFSTADISEAASKPTDVNLAQSLPAGSSGLHPNNMLRALLSMERKPYVLWAEAAGNKMTWPSSLDPVAILSRYVGSGIPVIVGLHPWKPGQRDGHAVVVVGDVFRAVDPPVISTSFPNAGILTPYFLVQDDQRGPNLRMAVDDQQKDGETPYNVRRHVRFIMVPLPDKVFMPADIAEVIAWEALKNYVAAWTDFKNAFKDMLGSSEALGDEVTEAWASNQILAKTYLTFGWKHKMRVLESGASEVLRETCIFQNLPRLVWITEFARLQDVNFLETSKRRIFGHCITDATSTGAMQPPLLFHSPGSISLYRTNSRGFFPDASHEFEAVPDDCLYKGRLKPERGA
jgi:hypothetical protein